MATTSKTEIAKRITDLLQTRCVGQAVADCLEQQTVDWAHRAVIADLRARRVEDRVESAQRGSEVRSARTMLMTAARTH